jgi:hypothetical protein
MTTLRSRLFLEGILLGGMCGLAVGSLIAFQIGSGRVTDMMNFLVGLRGESGPKYKHILQ